MPTYYILSVDRDENLNLLRWRVLPANEVVASNMAPDRVFTDHAAALADAIARQRSQDERIAYLAVELVKESKAHLDLLLALQGA
jgi:hypothetical protein